MMKVLCPSCLPLAWWPEHCLSWLIAPQAIRALFPALWGMKASPTCTNPALATGSLCRESYDLSLELSLHSQAILCTVLCSFSCYWTAQTWLLWGLFLFGFLLFWFGFFFCGDWGSAVYTKHVLILFRVTNKLWLSKLWSICLNIYKTANNYLQP